MKLAVNPTKGYLGGWVRIVVKGFLRERSWQVEYASNWIKEFMDAVSILGLPFRAIYFLIQGLKRKACETR